MTTEQTSTLHQKGQGGPQGQGYFSKVEKVNRSKPMPIQEESFITVFRRVYTWNSEVSFIKAYGINIHTIALEIQMIKHDPLGFCLAKT